ncbi:MAG: prepilin-type N-terminal cleavage/methylation domain-containing protein [Bdellovibrionota bacterium]
MKNNIKGFTLIELMVVVGIIGIITSIAVPSFQRFQAKAKQANAKVELSAIYGMEKAFYTEFGTYHTNLVMIGFTPDGVKLDSEGCVDETDLTKWPTRYYTVGTSGSPGVTTSVGGITVPCTGKVTAYVRSNPAAAMTLTGSVSTSAFEMQAKGDIGGSRPDHWEVNNYKQFTNSTQGI